MLEYIQGKGRDQVYAASLIRLLRYSQDKSAVPVLLAALQDSSPLVRAAAAETLGRHPSTETIKALVAAAADDFRLVRVKAAGSLANFPRNLITKEMEMGLQKAQEEYRNAILMEPDKWSSWNTIGNTHVKRDELQEAIAAYQTALAIKPQAVQPMLSLSYAQFRLGETEAATKSLVEAIKTEPDNFAALKMAATAKYGQAALQQAEAYFNEELKKDAKSARRFRSMCHYAARTAYRGNWVVPEGCGMRTERAEICSAVRQKAGTGSEDWRNRYPAEAAFRWQRQTISNVIRAVILCLIDVIELTLFIHCDS
ncbi:HEAT repeat domain-containing protein [Geotalea toluenoxydans]|uniref:HEAT repeat domain-containing protein n=1 Tax=Geotalea toluenoxydans TaxID=421624 RepID=UPI001FB444DC|nr:HEAT repeat domain-containing protein [Geotalea toluenoxydans]